MIKILLLSDTHSIIDQFIMKYIQEADEIWHAGDIGSKEVLDKLESTGKPLRLVYGNIDGQEIRKMAPEIIGFVIEGVRVIMTHIGGYPGRYSVTTKDMLKREKPDLFICGHSHILKIIYDKELKFLHLNPGAAGLEGFHQKRTMLRFTVDEKTRIANMEVIERDKKTEPPEF